MAILYTSTKFDDDSISNGSARPGTNGYAATILVDTDGIYGRGSMTISSNSRAIGASIDTLNAADGNGPYFQVVNSLGNFPGSAEERFAIGYWNTADISLSGWIGATNPSNTEQTDWAGNSDSSGTMVMHTANQTEDVYTLIVPTVSPLRQATSVRNGNSIVFHIPETELAVYAINANLAAAGSITSGMTDTQASTQILEYGYGLILKTGGATTLFNQG